MLFLTRLNKIFIQHPVFSRHWIMDAKLCSGNQRNPSEKRMQVLAVLSFPEVLTKEFQGRGKKRMW